MQKKTVFVHSSTDAPKTTFLALGCEVEIRGVVLLVVQNDSFFLSLHEAKKLSHFDLKIWVKFLFRQW